MRLRKLLEEKESLEDELYMLHHAALPPAVYRQTRHNIEYRLACLEEQIEFEERFRPFRITLIVAVVVMVCILAYGLINY
jgi:hypothetical protein